MIAGASEDSCSTLGVELGLLLPGAVCAARPLLFRWLGLRPSRCMALDAAGGCLVSSLLLSDPVPFDSAAAAAKVEVDAWRPAVQGSALLGAVAGRPALPAFCGASSAAAGTIAGGVNMAGAAAADPRAGCIRDMGLSATAGCDSSSCCVFAGCAGSAACCRVSATG